MNLGSTSLVFLCTLQIILGSSSEDIEHLCSDCRLVSNSIDEITRRPRQMDSYGSIADRIDPDKINKNICKEIAKDQDRERCRSFYFEHASAVLASWKRSPSPISFFDFVCIKKLKYCCPRGSFGPKCTKCLRCNFNQQCRGEGTRAGNGTCLCKEGHTGPSCSSCLPGFYSDTGQQKLDQTQNKTQKFTCKACHRSCRYCRREGPLGCEVCNNGFAWVPAYGCSDIDECIKSNNKICGPNTFCVNTEGSYFCYECDRACDGCHGDGPDMCLRCAKGYKQEKGNCVAEKKTIIPPAANYYRYALYFGLSVCTCIVLRNDVYFASVIGLAVSLYIGFSEYVMYHHADELMSMK